MLFINTALYTGVRIDPLTHRPVSARCWNGFHQERGLVKPHLCKVAGCTCYCHPEKDPDPPRTIKAAGVGRPRKEAA